jgi:ADP-heptose:LPS heptosyltransferase
MNIDTPTKILVRRRAALGDVIMASGTIRELKKSQPDSLITVETEFPLVFNNNPNVAEICNWNQTDLSNYDVVYNLDDAYECNPKNHFVDSMFYRVFGCAHSTLPKSPDLHVTDSDKQIVDADLGSIGNKYIVVHMRNWHWPLKNIDLNTWLDVFVKIFETTVDYKIVTVGGNTDFSVDHPLIFNANGRYTPQQLKYLLDGAKCFVGIDSAPFQIAAASDTHVIGLLTHNSPEFIMPLRHHDTMWNATAIQAEVDCVGCNSRQKVPVRQIVCERGNFPCARTWDTNKIAKAILEQLK